MCLLGEARTVCVCSFPPPPFLFLAPSMGAPRIARVTMDFDVVNNLPGSVRPRCEASMALMVEDLFVVAYLGGVARALLLVFPSPSHGGYRGATPLVRHAVGCALFLIDAAT